jgi:hypothetical protein
MTRRPFSIVERHRSLERRISALADVSSPTADYRAQADTAKEKGGTRLVLALLLPLACCAGIALLSVLGGAGLVATGVAQASFWLVGAGLVVSLLAGVWIVWHRLGKPRR